jgi:ankyrin repeat domain-containing protein 50
MKFPLNSGNIATLIYYASLLGLHKIVQKLINTRQPKNSQQRALVNAQSKEYGNALQAASYGGHEKMVQILINAKTDVNTQSKEYGNALQAVSYGDHEKIIQMLIDAKADVNA